MHLTESILSVLLMEGPLLLFEDSLFIYFSRLVRLGSLTKLDSD